MVFYIIVCTIIGFLGGITCGVMGERYSFLKNKNANRHGVFNQIFWEINSKPQIKYDITIEVEELYRIGNKSKIKIISISGINSSFYKQVSDLIGSFVTTNSVTWNVPPKSLKNGSGKKQKINKKISDIINASFDNLTKKKESKQDRLIKRIEQDNIEDL